MNGINCTIKAENQSINKVNSTHSQQHRKNKPCDVSQFFKRIISIFAFEK